MNKKRRMNRPVKKRLISMILLLAVLLSLPSVCFADSKSHTLYFDISFKVNRLFNKYDVDLLLDGQKAASLKHGVPFTMILSVSEGEHTVAFCKSEDSAVKAEETIRITQDSSYRCTIQTESKKIVISGSQVIASLEGSAIPMPDVRLSLLEEAAQELRDLGFINVQQKTEKNKDVSGKTREWIVLQQDPAPGKAFDKTVPITLTCKKTADYVKETFVQDGLTVADAMSKANEVGYEVYLIDKTTGRDMRNEYGNASQTDLKQWKVIGCEEVESNRKVAILFIQYQGIASVPAVEGMMLKYAITELQLSGFSQIKYVTADGKPIKEKDAGKWKVATQSQRAGTRFSATQEISLTCVSYEALERPTRSAAGIIADTGPGSSGNNSAAMIAGAAAAVAGAAQQAASTATPRPSPSPTPKPTPVPTATPSPTLKPTATPKPTPKPTATPKPTPKPTATPKPTPKPTATPKPTPTPKPAASASAQEHSTIMVWIPNNGKANQKYHSNPSCSRMKNPIQIPLDVAAANYQPCQRCYG